VDVAEEANDPRVRWMRVDHGGLVPPAMPRWPTRAVRSSLTSMMTTGWIPIGSTRWRGHLSSVPTPMSVWRMGDRRPHSGLVEKHRGTCPRMFLNAWDRDRLREDNLADMGGIAPQSGA